MEHTDAPLTPPRDPRVAPPPMTNAEIRQWIDACNHEPARQVLRSIVGLREEKFDIVPMGEIRHLKGQINTLAAKIESDAKVIAALRERMTQIRAFVIVINENNWRDIVDHIARQAAEYEQTAGENK